MGLLRATNWPERTRRYTPFAIYLILALLVAGPLLGPGYVLSLDMVFGPFAPSPSDIFYGFDAPVLGAKHLPDMIASALASVIPMWVVEKLIIISILVLAGVGAHKLVPVRSEAARYFAGTLYAINPFVYARFLAGQWYVLLAYAFIPFAVAAFISFLESPSFRRGARVAVFLSLTAVNSHMFAIASALLLAVYAATVARSRPPLKVHISVLAIAGAAALLNAYWLVPALTADNTVLQAIGARDLIAFAPQSDIISPSISVAAMYGFWRDGYAYPLDVFWPAALVIIPILWLAILGTVFSVRAPLSVTFAVCGAAAALLGAGVEGPLSGLFRFLFDKVPLFDGFRDSQKFVGLLVLAYAYLGAIGLDKLSGGFAKRFGAIRLRHAAWVIAAIGGPCVYTFTMFWGFNGALGLADYPDDWREARDILDREAGNTNVLVLPWDTYTNYGWVPNDDSSVRTLARAYFPQSLVFPKHVLNRGGIDSQSSSPEQRFMNDLVERAPSGSTFGREIAQFGAGYVLLSKSASFTNYEYLYSQADLDLRFDGPTIALFRNNMVRTMVHEAGIKDGEIGQAVQVEEVSPVKYIVGGSPGDLLAIFPPNTDISGWRLDGEPAVRTGAGYSGVFERGERGELIYATFSRNLPWMLISVAALAVLAGALAFEYVASRRRIRARLRHM